MRWQTHLATRLIGDLPDRLSTSRLVETVADLIRDEHETYHDGPIESCESRLCRMFFNVVARLTA